MGQIGCLGDIVFMVSSEQVETINNMQWSGSARYSTHKRHKYHALTEYEGIDPDKISFDIYLTMYLGADPLEEINKIWKYEREGLPQPLVLGEKGYGKYRWTINSHKAKMQTYDGKGNLTGALVSVDLLEYLSK